MRRSRKEWKELVAEFRGSGASAAEFARRRGVKTATLYWWCSELRGELAGATVAPVRFLPVRAAAVVPSSKVVEARVGAVAVRFECGTDIEYIAALLGRLRDAC